MGLCVVAAEALTPPVSTPSRPTQHFRIDLLSQSSTSCFLFFCWWFDSISRWRHESPIQNFFHNILIFWDAKFWGLFAVSIIIHIQRHKHLKHISLCVMNLYTFHFLYWITEINQLFDDILIHWDELVYGELNVKLQIPENNPSVIAGMCIVIGLMTSTGTQVYETPFSILLLSG